MTKITTKELRLKISDVLRRAEEGESFLVTRADKTVANLTPSLTTNAGSEDPILETLSLRGILDLPEEEVAEKRRERHRVPARGASAAAMVIEDRR